LIEHGTDANPVICNGMTIILICSAIERRHIEAADVILKHMELNNLPMSDNDQAVLLCVTAACDQEVLLQQSLDHGCHPDATQRRLEAPFRKDQLLHLHGQLFSGMKRLCCCYSIMVHTMASNYLRQRFSREICKL